MKLEITNVDLEEIDPRWTRFSPWDKSWKRNWNTVGLFTSYSLILRKLMILLKGKVIQYSRTILNSEETCENVSQEPISRVRVGNNMSDSFKICNGLK